MFNMKCGYAPAKFLQVNTTSEDGCNLYTCGVNSKGDLVLQTKVTTCPPFNRQACLDEGVRHPQSHVSCRRGRRDFFCTGLRC